MKGFLLFILLGLAWVGQAQNQFTYVTDRKFPDPSDLVGYDFRPSVKETVGGDKIKLKESEYSFGITINNLYVDGEGIKGVYSLNNIHPMEYGYILKLMNARDPMLQGHLKIIMNNANQVEALIFKRARRENEVIFYLPELTKTKRKREKEFFTDRGELIIEDKDSIWGMEIHPFWAINLEAGIQERLQGLDSTSISFVEDVQYIEKKKKKKKKKQEVVASVDPEISTERDTKEAEEEEVKFKIERNYFVKLRSRVRYDDGGVEYKTWTFPVKKISEREDEQAGPGEERFLLKIDCDKTDDLFLYLTPDRAVSSMEIGNKLYLTRGY